jgi:hypothetical protein
MIDSFIEGVRMFFPRRFFSFLAVAALVSLALATGVYAATGSKDQGQAKVKAPLNIAILIQDDLVSHVSNELGVTADFIRSLPPGSRAPGGW